jgi:hypothetical protein
MRGRRARAREQRTTCRSSPQRASANSNPTDCSRGALRHPGHVHLCGAGAQSDVHLQTGPAEACSHATSRAAATVRARAFPADPQPSALSLMITCRGVHSSFTQSTVLGLERPSWAAARAGGAAAGAAPAAAATSSRANNALAEAPMGSQTVLIHEWPAKARVDLGSGILVSRCWPAAGSIPLTEGVRFATRSNSRLGLGSGACGRVGRRSMRYRDWCVGLRVTSDLGQRCLRSLLE